MALLAVLMLRGPQTSSELRANGERLHRFADVSAVEGFLDELAARDPGRGGPLVVKMARAPGSRESRWAHLLSGPPVAGAVDRGAAAPEPDHVAIGELAALKARQAVLEGEVGALREQVERLYRELGVARA